MRTNKPVAEHIIWSISPSWSVNTPSAGLGYIETWGGTGKINYWGIIWMMTYLKGVPENFFFLLFLAISSSNLHQIQKVRPVLKSACCQLFKTGLTFDFWPSRSWDIGARTYQGSFLFFTWIWRNGGDYSVSAFVITLLDFQNLNLLSCINFCDITNTNDDDLKKIPKINFFWK